MTKQQIIGMYQYLVDAGVLREEDLMRFAMDQERIDRIAEEFKNTNTNTH